MSSLLTNYYHYDKLINRNKGQKNKEKGGKQ